jgi:hypothetical protein
VFGIRQRDGGEERSIFASEEFDPLRLDHAKAEEAALIPIARYASEHQRD